MIDKAFQFAKNKHKGQLDDLGLDYFSTHVFVVYLILEQLKSPEKVLCAALLHDTLEDTDTTYEELVKEFGIEVADLVMEVTKSGTKTEGYYFPNLKSRDGIIIKFADRLSNLSRMENWTEKRQAHYIKKSKFWKTEP